MHIDEPEGRRNGRRRHPCGAARAKPQRPCAASSGCSRRSRRHAVRACIVAKRAAGVAASTIAVDRRHAVPTLRDGASLARQRRTLDYAGLLNRAFALHGDRDVVVLQADAEVAGDWLDRLAGARQRAGRRRRRNVHQRRRTRDVSAEDTREQRVARRLHGRDARQAVRARQSRSSRRSCRACTVRASTSRAPVSRRLGGMNAVGTADGHAIEIDFSLRAHGGGFETRVAGDTFVANDGEGSFGGRAMRIATHAATTTLAHLHPERRVAARRRGDDGLRLCGPGRSRAARRVAAAGHRLHFTRVGRRHPPSHGRPGARSCAIVPTCSISSRPTRIRSSCTGRAKREQLRGVVPAARPTWPRFAADAARDRRRAPALPSRARTAAGDPAAAARERPAVRLHAARLLRDLPAISSRRRAGPLLRRARRGRLCRVPRRTAGAMGPRHPAWRRRSARCCGRRRASSRRRTTSPRASSAICRASRSTSGRIRSARRNAAAQVARVVIARATCRARRGSTSSRACAATRRRRGLPLVVPRARCSTTEPLAAVAGRAADDPRLVRRAARCRNCSRPNAPTCCSFPRRCPRRIRTRCRSRSRRARRSSRRRSVRSPSGLRVVRGRDCAAGTRRPPSGTRRCSTRREPAARLQRSMAGSAGSARSTS